MTYFLTPEAEAELAEAVTYYAEHISAAMAERFLAASDKRY